MFTRTLRPILLLLTLVITVPASATSNRFLDIFAPLCSEWAALSPDAKRLAYSWRQNGELIMFVIALDNPGICTARVIVATDETSTPLQLDRRHARYDEERPATIEFLGWSDNDTIVVSTNRELRYGWQDPSDFDKPTEWHSATGAIYCFNANGRDARLVTSARRFRRQPVSRSAAVTYCDLRLGRILSATHLLVLADGRPHSVEIATGKLEQLGPPDAGKWAARRSAVPPPQHLAPLETALPEKSISILQSVAAETQFLLLVQSEVDPGAFHIWQPGALRSLEVVPRAPALADRIPKLHRFDVSNGHTRARGWLTVPRRARTKRAPVILLDADKPRALSPAKGLAGNHKVEFRPEILALSEMGFATLQLEGPDVVAPSAPAERLAAAKLALKRLSEEHAVDSSRVALYATGAGGALAFRLLHLSPESFRCAVLINPRPAGEEPGDGEEVHHSPAVDGAPKPNPVLVLESGAHPRWIRRTLSLHKPCIAGQLETLSADFNAGRPVARATTFGKIEAFLNEHVYDYTVREGPLRILGSE